MSIINASSADTVEPAAQHNTHTHTTQHNAVAKHVTQYDFVCVQLQSPEASLGFEHVTVSLEAGALPSPTCLNDPLSPWQLQQCIS